MNKNNVKTRKQETIDLRKGGVKWPINKGNQLFSVILLKYDANTYLYMKQPIRSEKKLNGS